MSKSSQSNEESGGGSGGGDGASELNNNDRNPFTRAHLFRSISLGSIWFYLVPFGSIWRMVWLGAC